MYVFLTVLSDIQEKGGSQLCNFPIFRNLLVSNWAAINYYKDYILQVIPVVHFDSGCQNVIVGPAAAASPDSLFEMQI